MLRGFLKLAIRVFVVIFILRCLFLYHRSSINSTKDVGAATDAGDRANSPLQEFGVFAPIVRSLREAAALIILLAIVAAALAAGFLICVCSCCSMGCIAAGVFLSMAFAVIMAQIDPSFGERLARDWRIRDDPRWRG